MSEMTSGSMPPDIASLLGGAAAPPAGSEGGDVMDLIRQALELVRKAAVELEGEGDTLAAEKITSLLQQILADEEKELEDAMAGKASPRMLRQAYA